MIQKLYQEIRDQLAQADVSMPELEARELLAAAMGVSPQKIFLQTTLTVQMQKDLQQLVARRLSGEPLAYILREWDFYGITLHVTPDVLIPRSDTERLCELAIAQAKQIEHPQILDLCAGSGCIGLAILSTCTQATVTAVDISARARVIAMENAQKLQLNDRYTCVAGNALQPPPEQIGQFSIMVCNPPYITAHEMQELDDSVAKYEPHLALYGGEDGLDFYRSVMRDWTSHVTQSIYFECGWKQSQQVAEICRKADWKPVVETDYAGVPRIVIATPV